jgi:hypothetical protein
VLEQEIDRLLALVQKTGIFRCAADGRDGLRRLLKGEDMVERRSVLKLGATSAAWALVNVPVRAFGAMPADSHGSLYRAVFDERFAEGLAFADEMNSRGVITSGIRGDVAKLWYEDLRARLRQGPAPVAGLTDRVALFCLEELARDVGMKVFFRVDHMVDKSGHVRHEATGPASAVEATRALAAGSGFGQAMAALACRCEAGGPGNIAAQKRTGPFSPEDKTALVSWVMA